MAKYLVFILALCIAGCTSTTGSVPTESKGEAMALGDRWGDGIPPDQKNEGSVSASSSGKGVVGSGKTFLSGQAVFPIPGLYTVQFSLKVKIDDTLNPPCAEVQALIEWSVGGVTIPRLITLYDGQSISGTGEGVRVRITDVTSTGPDGAEITAAFSVSPGARSSSSIPPTLARLNIEKTSYNALVPNTSFTMQIPQGVGIKSVMATVGPIQPGIAVPSLPDNGAQINHRNPSLINPTLKKYDPRYYDFVPIAPGATEILIQNMLGSVFNQLWDVTFGIDG